VAAKGVNLVTMADVAKDRKTGIGAVAEVLQQVNSMHKDCPFMEMNEGTIHKETIRSSLPEIYYRKANQPIPYSKSTTEERSFSAAHFESKSGLDKMVAERGGKDRLAFNRWNQAIGHIQAHGREQQRLMIYGSPLNSPQQSPGFADIYSTLDSSQEVSKQIVDAGGSASNNTSIYMVTWGLQSTFGVYPSGTMAGLKRTDHSAGGKLVQIHGTDANGNPGTFWGYEEQFEVDQGLVVKDYRQNAWIANIDINALKAGTGPDLLELMIEMLYKIENPEVGTPVIYCNRTIEAYLDLLAVRKVGSGGGLTYDNYQGERVLMFRKYPIRRVDAILNSEAAVTA